MFILVGYDPSIELVFLRLRFNVSANCLLAICLSSVATEGFETSDLIDKSQVVV